MQHIKANYRRLVMQWHPDRSKESREKCSEMTARIASAYKVVTAYCNHYRFSFSREEVKHHLSEEDLFTERFSTDPFWGRQS